MGSGSACTNVIPSYHTYTRVNVTWCFAAAAVTFTIVMANITAQSNSIISFRELPFSRRSNQEKLAVKQLGPPRPNLNIKQISKKGGKSYTRGFSRCWYERKNWLAGCELANGLFCYPCVLIHPDGCTTETPWTTTGFKDMHHLSEKIKKHEASRIHIDSCLKLSAFGSVNIATQLDDGYRLALRRHNDEVGKNRHILGRLIDGVKFCGVFELALRGRDESEGSSNPGIFRGLVQFIASLDEVFEEHLKTATVFKGTSKTVQNELLDCMAAVIRARITEEVKSASFVAIQADETTDVSTQTQMVMVLRYIDGSHAVQERFFEFVPLSSSTADSIATAIMERLNSLFTEEERGKLIAQAYDGANVMRGEKAGVQQKVREHYKNAHYLHCYAHQLNLIMQQATSQVPAVRVFFSDLNGISSFFSRSPKRTTILDQVVARRLPRASATRWNFNSRVVNTVYENLDDLIECFEAISTDGSFDCTTVREASGYLRMLQDDDFKFFLHLFHQIMPHVDIMYQQLQKKDIDAVFIKRALQSFTSSVQAIRDQSSSPEQQQVAAGTTGKRRALGEQDKQRLSKEVCDTILGHANERFSFTSHLVSATLLQGDLFEQYSHVFPDEALNTTAKAYPMLNKAKLKTELSLIYESPDFKGCSGALALYQVLQRNNLHETLSETVALLNILITTPMTTAEAERCFSTLKRIKTFLRNSMGQDRLNALAMLSMERELVRNMPDFNERVIDHFAALKERRAKFQYK
ncbi:zinc finger MYM-type protein 1-like [Platichthys flesus]|uniref:zinc finger MYM-type protein 1-like n=1 Tax=Platichthys flesus TaxID=8260 RepID=UPI002DBEC290|nr:zinc finger MYM-type protein 1-like [Platichthys flesus]